MDEEVDIVPDLMIVAAVIVKALIRIPVQVLPIVPTDEANILHVVQLKTGLFSQLSKGVNDDTKDNVEQYDDNDQIE